MIGRKKSGHTGGEFAGVMGRSHMIGVAGFAAVVAAGMVAAACGSSSASNPTKSQPASTSSTSALSSAASFFVGKTITFIAPDAPGGGYDLYARAFAPALGSILHATVNVENVPGGGTVTGTDQMAAAAPDGLTLGDVNVAGDIGDVLQNLTALKVNLNTLSWIGNPAPEEVVMITPEASSIKSFSQLLSTKQTVTFGGSKSGIVWTFGASLMRAFNIPTKFLTGYPTETATSQGIIANEFDLTMGDISGAYYTDIIGGKARVLLVSGPSSLPSVEKAIAGAPTVPQELSKLSAPAKKAMQEAEGLVNVGFAFAGPPGIPAARLQVLQNAFMEAAQSQSVKATLLKESAPLNPISGSTLVSDINASEAGASALKPYIQ